MATFTDQEKSLRLFFAVELPEEARAQINRYIQDLRAAASASGVRWERAEKLHITLKFLGETNAARLEAASRAAHRAAMIAPFELTVEGTGAFPPRSNSPRVLWLGIEDSSKRLAALGEKIEEELAAEGFAREARLFHPHLTVARLQRTTRTEARQLASIHATSKFRSLTFAVTEFVLMRSELSREGSRYTILERHKLNAD